MVIYVSVKNHDQYLIILYNLSLITPVLKSVS